MKGFFPIVMSGYFEKEEECFDASSYNIDAAYFLLYVFLLIVYRRLLGLLVKLVMSGGRLITMTAAVVVDEIDLVALSPGPLSLSSSLKGDKNTDKGITYVGTERVVVLVIVASYVCKPLMRVGQAGV